MTKGVREVDLMFYDKYIDALMDQNGIKRVIEIENNQCPSTITIEEDGKIKNYRIKNFQRNNDRGTFLDLVYILIS